MKKRLSIRDLSLRTKLILCLLGTTVVSTAVVGGLAYWRLTQKFDHMVMQESVRRFTADVSDYFRAYGSWEAGQQRESFRSFVERRNVLLGRPVGSHIGPLRQSRPGAQREAPALPDLTPDTLVVPPVAPGNTPPPPSNVMRPPFRFYLFGDDLHSLTDLPPYRAGDLIRPEHRDLLHPIESDGRIVAHFVPEGRASYSDLDLGYLAAMREALAVGAVAGLVLTMVLGFLLASHLNRRLRRLTRAVQAMGKGELKQKVQVESSDEVGVLAKAFNRMSADLAQKYTELEESKVRIENMAMQLHELSIRDALTDLYNRRYFDEHCARLFQHAVRYQRPFSVMLADIDHFKSINDTYSHAIGDEVLRRIGKLLASTTRSTDLVARYGGEEFVIAFPEADLQKAHETCDTLRQRIEEAPWYEVHPDLKVSISIGVYSDSAARDYHALLEVADQLLYRAKGSGRNRVCSPLNTDMAVFATKVSK